MVPQRILGHTELFTLAEPEAVPEWGRSHSSTALRGPLPRKSSRDSPRMVPAGHLLATWQRQRHPLPTWNNDLIIWKVYSFFPVLSILNSFFLTALTLKASLKISLSQAFEQLLFLFKHKTVWDDTYKSVVAMQRAALGACACRNIFELEQTDLQLSVSDSRCTWFQKETSPFALS